MWFFTKEQLAHGSFQVTPLISLSMRNLSRKVGRTNLEFPDKSKRIKDGRLFVKFPSHSISWFPESSLLSREIERKKKNHLNCSPLLFGKNKILSSNIQTKNIFLTTHTTRIPGVTDLCKILSRDYSKMAFFDQPHKLNQLDFKRLLSVTKFCDSDEILIFTEK